MNTLTRLRTGLVATALLLTYATTSAQRYHRHRYEHGRTTVVVKPVATAPAINSTGSNDRLAIAVAYLQKSRYLTVKKYAKMTRLTRNMAKAELDAFAADARKPVIAVMNGKKRLYTLRG